MVKSHIFVARGCLYFACMWFILFFLHVPGPGPLLCNTVDQYVIDHGARLSC